MGPGFEPLSAHPITTRSFDLVFFFLLFSPSSHTKSRDAAFLKLFQTKHLHSTENSGILISVVEATKKLMGR